MKRISKIFFSIVSALVFAIGCSEVDKLSERVDSLEGRVTALETLTSTLNDNILALQKLAGGSTINSVALKDGVYTITLSNGETLTINQGAVGVGNAPIMSIDSEGYWMVDYGKGAEYILVDGKKVKAVGSNGVTPKFSVDKEGYWTVSYDGGSTYARVKDEEGNPVKAVVDGSSAQDSFFDDVKYENGVLTIVPKGGEPLVLPVISSFLCAVKDAADVQVFSYGQTRTYNVEQKGVASAIVTAPEGWTAILTDTQLSITAPAGTKATIADSSTDVSILAISTQGLATVAKVRVMVEGGTVVVNPSATVTFTSADASSATFEVSVSDVTGWKYICQAASEPAPSAETLAASGTEGTTGTVVVEGLAAETEYVLYVLPYNGETLGAIASATGKTTAATVVDYPGLYGKYMKGEDVVICGVTINKTTHPDAHYITAESEDKTIGTTGVYFIDPALADVIISAGATSLIVASNTEDRATVSRAGQFAVKATENEDYLYMYNVKYVSGMTAASGNIMGVNGDDAKTFVFETISFEKCAFEIMANYNLIYSQFNIANFSMVDCDIKLHANTLERNIFATNTNNATEYALTFKNNLFYCTDGDVTGYQIFKNTNAIVSSLEVSKNTFAKVYAKATNGYFAAKTIKSAEVISNLFYIPDYATLVPDKYVGILYPTDKGTTGLSFKSNLAYYAGSVPEKRMKCNYYANDPSGALYNKPEDPFSTADFANGIFTQTETYKSYGAQR